MAPGACPHLELLSFTVKIWVQKPSCLALYSSPSDECTWYVFKTKHLLNERRRHFPAGDTMLDAIFLP